MCFLKYRKKSSTIAPKYPLAAFPSAPPPGSQASASNHTRSSPGPALVLRGTAGTHTQQVSSRRLQVPTCLGRGSLNDPDVPQVTGPQGEGVPEAGAVRKKRAKPPPAADTHRRTPVPPASRARAAPRRRPPKRAEVASRISADMFASRPPQRRRCCDVTSRRPGYVSSEAATGDGGRGRAAPMSCSVPLLRGGAWVPRLGGERPQRGCWETPRRGSERVAPPRGGAWGPRAARAASRTRAGCQSL